MTYDDSASIDAILTVLTYIVLTYIVLGAVLTYLVYLIFFKKY